MSIPELTRSCSWSCTSLARMYALAFSSSSHHGLPWRENCRERVRRGQPVPFSASILCTHVGRRRIGRWRQRRANPGTARGRRYLKRQRGRHGFLGEAVMAWLAVSMCLWAGWCAASRCRVRRSGVLGVLHRPSLRAICCPYMRLHGHRAARNKPVSRHVLPDSLLSLVSSNRLFFRLQRSKPCRPRETCRSGVWPNRCRQTTLSSTPDPAAPWPASPGRPKGTKRRWKACGALPQMLLPLPASPGVGALAAVNRAL